MHSWRRKLGNRRQCGRWPGLALRNPVAIAVPCHRVIGSDGSLTGYRWGVERKKKLLRMERGEGVQGAATACRCHRQAVGRPGEQFSGAAAAELR